ncbi:CGNR zinc finger domain-containing protein [Janibacter alkaliphilus]|uniref:Putative RNA-binding Zn ribbon-like protein n=1 Tax=Janibacter alkaliphilus TaxID=1069963 RepID=A0A852X519_9MICO|nr:CGNR zinc finger domain-containing protein [Janibacter alkaliphilus]NYG35863.1 putative RNA-binding Zn ribbon-like protein [Janibacter alkaliphilus]
MLFAHDTVIALHGAAALVNTMGGIGPDTADERPEILHEPADLARFVQEWEWSGHPTVDQQALADVRALRPRLHELWQEVPDAAFADVVNALLADADARPRLVTHDDLGWHIHATPDDAPIARRMQVEAAMAMVDVLRAGERSRLRVCAADDCDRVLVDLSRNRSKRYCDHGCGNRVAAAAYRSRRSG